MAENQARAENRPFGGGSCTAQCASGWLVGLVQNPLTNLCHARHTNKQGHELFSIVYLLLERNNPPSNKTTDKNFHFYQIFVPVQGNLL